MLGIIFTGGEAPFSQVIKQLFNNDDVKKALLIAADSGLETAIKAGIKPDWIIGDMDSLRDHSLLENYPSDRIIRVQSQKDHTDTELAFSFAVEQGCDDIWLIGGGGGRIDHLLGIRSLLERDIFPRRWITDTADIYCASSDETETVFSFSADIGNIVSIFPIGDGPWEVKSTSLQWALDDLIWDRGFFSLSNVTSESSFSVKVQKGRFMVVLTRRDVCQ